MKILYITLGYNPCGGVRILVEHLNRLTERGHSCSMVALTGETSLTWMPTNFKIISPEKAARVAKKADVVVATEANTMSVVMDLDTKARKYLFCQMRESLFFWRTNQEWALGVEEVYAQAKGILHPIVISQWLKDFFEDEYGYEDVPIVPNGVNTEMFWPDRLGATTWMPASGIHTGHKPRLLIEGHGKNEAKDIHNMSYQVVDIYRQHVQPVELWGFSQYVPTGEWDKYWVLPSQEEIRQIYSSCDVLVKASRYEGRSCVDPEAMACGCAVVRAIDTGDDDLIDGHNCLKVKYGDAQGMYDNLKRVLEDEALRKRLVENGLKYVKEHLGWDDKIDALEAAYAT